MKKTSTIVGIILFFVLVGGVLAYALGRFTPAGEAILGFQEETLKALETMEVHPQKPSISEGKICSIEEYGAVRGNAMATTQALERAIDDCYEAGGGKVVIPSGVWVSYPITLKSTIELHFQDGAVLQTSEDLAQYGDSILWRFEGMRTPAMPQPFIYANECRDVAITGNGIIRGNQDAWEKYVFYEDMWLAELYSKSEDRKKVKDRPTFDLPDKAFRPEVIGFMRCIAVEIDGITIEDVPRSAMRILMSKDVTLTNLSLESNAENGDALVLDSSSDILVRDANLRSEFGDGISLQSGLNGEGHGMDEWPLERLRIENVEIMGGESGVNIDRAMSADINRVQILNATIKDAKNGISAFIPEAVGGKIQHLLFKNVTVENAEESVIAIDMIAPDDMVDTSHNEREDTFINNIYFVDVTGTSKGKALVLEDLSHPRSVNEKIHFTNVELTSKEPSFVEGLRKSFLYDNALIAEDGSPHEFTKSEKVFIKNLSCKDAQNISCVSDATGMSF
jgi:polygalacturonase